MLETLKLEVYKANMELPQRGLVAYTWGNVSGIDHTHSPMRKHGSHAYYGQKKSGGGYAPNQ